MIFSLPPPENWQDFEALTRLLFECIYESPEFQQNGRQGQAQNGVDVYGPSNKPGEFIGVQCKGKDSNFGASVSEKELREEVKKSEGFEPAINKFFLVTTAQHDQGIQEIARKLTEEYAQENKEISIHVLGWQDLTLRIRENEKVLKAYYSELLVKTNEDSPEVHQKLDQLLDIAKSHQISVTDSPSKFAGESIDEHIHSQIDGYNDYIKNKPQTAIDLLTILKEQVWNSASDKVKYRISANIGASLYHISPENDLKAAQYFEEAYSYLQEDADANSKMAHAHYLRKDFEKAKSQSMMALDIDKTHSMSAAIFILSQTDVELDSLLKKVPTECLESPDVLLAIMDHRLTNNDFTWVDDAIQAKEKHPNSERIKLSAAEASLIKASRSGFALGLTSGGESSNDVDLKNQLVESANFLQKEWDKIKNSEVVARGAFIALCLAKILLFLKNVSAAKEVIDQALIIFPDNTNFIKCSARIALIDNDFENAIKTFEELEGDNESLLVLSEIHLENDPDKCLEYLEKVIINDLEPNQFFTYKLFKIKSLLRSKDISLEKKNELVETELECDGFEKGLSQFFNAELYEINGNSEVARALFDDAKNNSIAKGSPEERFFIAEQFDEKKLYHEVEELLMDQFTIDSDNPALRMYLNALIELNRRSAAKDLINQLPEGVKNSFFYLRAALSLHRKRGDKESEREVLNILLENYGDQLWIHIHHINFLVSEDNFSEVKQKIDSNDVESLIGPASDKMTLASFLIELGYFDRGLELAYKTALSNKDDIDIAQKYIALILKPDLTFSDLTQTQIQSDSVFEVENKFTGKQVFIIEDNQDLSKLTPLGSVVSSDHSSVHNALGLSVGDTFSSNDNDWTINWIKHKYLHYCHEMMRRIEILEPSEGRSMKTLYLETDKEGQMNFDPMIELVKKREQHVDSVIDKYQSSQLPIELCSKSVGSNSIEFWSTLLYKNIDVKVCQGTKEERDKAIEDIKSHNNAGCIVDELTLFLLLLLDITEAVVSVCGPIKTTQSVIDLFSARLADIKQNKRGRLGLVDGQLSLSETKISEHERTVESLEVELNWIKENVEVVSAESDIPLSDEENELNNHLGQTFYDTGFAAHHHNLLLICEDFVKRNLFNSQQEINSTWIQAFLIVARDNEKISAEDYYEATLKLVLMKHSFTTVNVGFFQYIVRCHKDKIETVSKLFFTESSDFISDIRIFYLFMITAWKDQYINDSVLKLATSVLLRQLFMGLSRKNLKLNNKEIFEIFLLPICISCPNFQNYFEIWWEGHFLGDLI